MSKHLKSFKPSIKWLDRHILEYLSFVLLFFIPLYPKIPLADILPGYIVRIRLDDILVAFAFLIWIIWVIRGKVSLKSNPLLIPIAVYLVVGLLSSLSAIFITKTVPMDPIHIGKLFLHFFRRIEYFSVFFIFFSSIKSLEQIKKYVYLTALVLIAVSIYGFGQKYLYWPAYSTMNREFSKGVRLYLTEHARVLSTFGGHYDLAAYLMLVLTLSIPLFFVVKKWLLRAIFLIASMAGFWLLILTVSRTSFIAYIFSITAVFGLLALKKGWVWSLSRWFVIIFISLFIMLSFGDLSSRFTHVLKLDNIKSALLSPIIDSKPSGDNVAYLDITDIGSESDIPPSIVKPGDPGSESGSGSGFRPPDVVGQDVDIVSDEDGNLVAKPRVYSQTAIKYDLSTGIRLDYTWPKAIEGFSRNPLLGSGYSTLTKSQIDNFTEAESTDNDFLRALGETGLLGFFSFFAIIGIAFWYSITNFKKINDIFYSTIVAAIIAGTGGLLVNAVYIDVFEASKVAYMFWILMAILITTVKLSIEKNKK